VDGGGFQAQGGIDNLDREILQKQIEAEALKKEDDKASKRPAGKATSPI
jgi:hypothetical protein